MKAIASLNTETVGILLFVFVGLGSVIFFGCSPSSTASASTPAAPSLPAALTPSSAHPSVQPTLTTSANSDVSAEESTPTHIPSSFQNLPHPELAPPLQNIHLELTPQNPPAPRISERRFLFDNRTSDALVEPAILTGTFTEASTPASSHFIPEGENFDAMLLQNLVLQNGSIPITVGIVAPVSFSQHTILPSGSKLLGTATAHRGRVHITFHRVVLPRGKATFFNAIAQEEDGLAGVAGYPVTCERLEALRPMLLQISDQVSSLFQSQNAEATDSFLSLRQNEAQRIDVTNRLERAIIQNVHETRPYLLLLAGTHLKVRLTSDLDISQAELGGGR